MNRGRRLLFQGPALLLWAMMTGLASAGWNLTPANDPNRNWSASVAQSGMYDDNFNATESNRQSGFRYNSDVALRAHVPLERLFMGLNYDYGVIYPQDIKLGGVSQSHSVNVLANYTYSPRLSLGLTENFVRALQPELVQTQAGVPVTVVQAGTYDYDTVGANLNYLLTPRWSLAANGSWDIWRYDNALIASNTDHEDYQTTLSTFYVVDQRTTVGVNYQYAVNLFSNPGTNNALNAQSHTGFLSVVRRFNPRLSLQLNSGFTYRKSEDGTINTAPSEYASLAYNYGPDDTVSLITGYSLSEVSVGITRQFSASENASVSLQVNHQLTARLRALANATYVYSTYVSPVPVAPGTPSVSSSAQEQALTAQLSLNYAFRNWLSAGAGYTYTRLISDLPGRRFDRNQISLGLTARY